MRVTESQKSGKFSISGITQDQMIELCNQLRDCDVREIINLRLDMQKSLIESLDEDALIDEYGAEMTPKKYLSNAGLLD